MLIAATCNKHKLMFELATIHCIAIGQEVCVIVILFSYSWTFTSTQHGLRLEFRRVDLREDIAFKQVSGKGVFGEGQTHH